MQDCLLDEPKTFHFQSRDVMGIHGDSNKTTALQGIDVSKSLYHLRLNGIEVASNAVPSTPTRTLCKTPAVSPLYSSQHRRMGEPSESRPSMTLRPFVLDFLREDDGRDTETIERSEENLKTPLVSRRVAEVEELTMSPTGKCHRRRIHSTTISNETDAVEVMLESSVSEDSDQDHEHFDEDCVKSSWNDCVNVSFLDQIQDDEASTVHDCPSFSPQTPAKIHFCGIPNWCDATSNQNIFLDDCSVTTGPMQHHRSAWMCPQNYVWCDEQHVNFGLAKATSMQSMVQNHICMALGDSMDDLCWQHTTPHMYQGRPASSSSIGMQSPVQVDPNASSPDEVSSKHRRSSTLPVYRRQHKFVSMRYNLNPFDDQGRSFVHRLHRPIALSKSQSFNLEKSQRQPANKTSHFRSSQMLHTKDWECGALDFALVYDDDNSTVHSQVNFPASRKPLVSQTFAEIIDGYESDPELSHRYYHLERTDSISQNQRYHLEQSITIPEFLNERWTFIWHSPSAHRNKSIAVHVWIERGQQLYDSLVLPKLCWKPILSQKGGSNTNHSRSSMIVKDVYSVELLDICRVLPMDKHDNKRFPFAVPQRLFSIDATSNNFELKQYFSTGPTATSIILESRSIADRIRYMNLLKLTVSTFAAKFLTNDPSSLTTFFHGPSITSPID